jgi:2-aminoethylphosphonate-pyruvate transaminase
LDILLEGASDLGLALYLDRSVQAPIIATFHMPPDKGFVFADFYESLARQGFIIYPGKLTHDPSFRIGCIGDVDAQDFKRLIVALGAALRDARGEA